jgi:hypothetical protein
MLDDAILTALAAAFPLIGFALFVIFWKLSRDDKAPDPIYQLSRNAKQ